MKCVIVSSRKRRQVKLSDGTTYVYVPLSRRELRKLNVTMINACWRIEVRGWLP